MQLTDHFALHELTKSSTAARMGINNEPGPEEIQALTYLCIGILEPVRMHFDKPFAPNSGYRCLELNNAVGSKPTSQHVRGEAADIELSGISNYDLAAWIADNLLFDQVILENYRVGYPDSGWVHVSFKRLGNRRKSLTYNNGRYLQGLMK
jgi:uncharacterized protein YcbK (DUF882 family)